MKKLIRLLSYVKNYKWLVTLHVISTLLTVFFSLLSIPALIPFLEIIFGKAELVSQPPNEPLSSANFEQHISYQLSYYIQNYGMQTTLTYLCFGIVAIFLLKNLFRYLALFFMAPVRNGIVRDIRQDLFQHTLTLPMSYFSEEKKGNIISKISSDVQEIEWSILNVIETIVREPLLIIGALSIMIYVSPTLSISVFALLIFTAVIIGGIGKTLRKHSSQIQGLLASMVSTVEEALGGVRIIKGFNAEKYQNEKFQIQNDSYRSALTRLLWRQDLASPISETLGVTTVALLIWLGFYQVQQGEIQVATFFSFLYAFFTMIEPAKKFSSANYTIQKGLAALDRVQLLLDTPNPITEKNTALSIKKVNRGINYKNINFRYPSADHQVLHDFTIEIPKGQIVALVGASGAGKSTVADLLPRFYDPHSGEIYIDDVNIKDYKINDLRGLIGIVSQEAILFNDSIYNNIVFGQKNVTKQDVEHAAKIANAHHFIMQSENGYQTVIGDRGAKLSGGQRQRITIARAILKNPDILILDEATSALDSKSEKLVQEALQSLLINRTAIVIAHRLSTIQNADKIVVLSQGKIIEQGTHKELINNKTEYKKLVEIQGL